MVLKGLLFCDSFFVTEVLIFDVFSYVAVNTENVSKFLPLPEMMKKEFAGMAFEELPILYIKATKNNTLMHAMDYKVNHPSGAGHKHAMTPFQRFQEYVNNSSVF